jgi:hypothetical protein
MAQPEKQEIDPRDLRSILKDAPAGAWVALSRNKTHVVATGDSIRMATDEAQARGETDPILIKIPLSREEMSDEI